MVAQSRFQRKQEPSAPFVPAASVSDAPHLVLQIGAAARARTLVIPLQERLVLGRGGAEEDTAPYLDLSSYDAGAQGVSRHHAAFHYQDGVLSVEDLRSTNGTRINGFTLIVGRSYRLRNGDELEFGSFRVCVRLIQSSAPRRIS